MRGRVARPRRALPSRLRALTPSRELELLDTAEGKGADRKPPSGRQPQPERALLTRKNLALLDKMARQRNTGQAAPPAPPGSTTQRTRPTAISTTAPGFASRARENGILSPPSSKPPANLQDLRRQYAASCSTASPTESAFKQYLNKVQNAPNEATMGSVIDKHLLKEHLPEEDYALHLNKEFTSFPENVGFNNGLSAPRPDIVEGLTMRAFYPFPVSQDLEKAVLCQHNTRSIALPHLAGEWKGPGKDLEGARVQSAYDGAALVCARNEALSYLEAPDAPGTAQITTFTTDGTNLNLFAHYARPSSVDGQLQYHQYPITSTVLTGSHQDFKKGRDALRNAQEYAKQQAQALRDQLRDHWKKSKAARDQLKDHWQKQQPPGTFQPHG